VARRRSGTHRAEQQGFQAALPHKGVAIVNRE
jgi:hypothetical protein